MIDVDILLVLYDERFDLLIVSIALRESEKMARLMSCLLESLYI